MTALVWTAVVGYGTLLGLSVWAGKGVTESRQTRSIGYAVGAFLIAFGLAVVSINERPFHETVLWVLAFLFAWWMSDKASVRLIAVGDARRTRTRRLFGLED